MYKRFGTRGRAVFTSILVGLIVFAVSSPIATNLYELIFPPSQVTNIKIVEKNNELDITWGKNLENDLAGYVVSLNGEEEIKLDKETLNYSFYQLDNSTSYTLNLSSIDESGKRSTTFVTVVQPKEKAETSEFNLVSEPNNSRTIILTAIAIAVVLFLLNLWVLFFKLNKSTIFTIAAFPAFCIIPFLIFSFSLIASVNNFGNKLLLSLIVVAAVTAVNYLLILTSNILNGSIYQELPLLQAGKASQFIFSLISSYLILIYAFGSYQDFLLRIIVSLPFIYYFSYSSIWMNKNVSSNQVFTRSLAITLIMGLTLLVVSIWPIDSVYAILAASVIFYILLNVALEIRKNLNRTVWVEYGVLTVLILILLFANSSWGINGSII